MRIVLVRANSDAVSSPPPIGLGYLSYAVKHSRGDQVLIIDGRRFRIPEQSMINQIKDFQPDLVGITAITMEARYVASLVAGAKKEMPNVPVVVGGPHATAWGPSLLETFQSDYLVFGEGEDVLVELLDALEGKANLADIKGLAWRDGGEIRANVYRPPIDDLDRLHVDWEAIGPEKYFRLWGRSGFHTHQKSGRKLQVFTSRGCPMGCAYCHNIFGRKYRTFSTKRVVDDMIELRDRYGVREIEIHDDFFNCRLDRAKEVLSEIIERKVGCYLAFPNGLRVDRVDEELLDLLIRAGTYQVYYAIESASPRIQKLTHKNLDLKRAREVVNMSVRRRLIVGVYYMLGFPDESEEELRMTIDYAVSLPNHISHFFHLMPFPGTEISQMNPEVAEKVRKFDYGSYYHVAFNLSAVSEDTLAKMRQYAYRRFYFSLPRIMRLLRDMPKNVHLLRSLGIFTRGFQQSRTD